MKHTLLPFFLLLSIISTAQQKTSTPTFVDIRLIQEKAMDKKLASWEDIKRKYPINTIQQVEYLSMLAKVNERFNKDELSKSHLIIGTKINDIVTLKIPVSKLNEVINYDWIDYIEIAEKASINLDQAIKDVRADSVQKGINLPQAYTGKDVYIGITDWGFDYTHPNFYDTLLTETRIAAAWDQYKQSGPSPDGFQYGTEYNTVTELLAAKSDTANIYSYAYHGSHVGGICGGSGAGTNYRGVAFEAQYLMATFLIDAASVIDAYEWMYQKSVQDQKRLVINQSWGLHHMGNLDGTSMLSQAIDYYSQLGVVFVSSGGNNGDVLFHIKKTFTNDTIKTRINFYTYGFETMWGQSISLWGEQQKSFSTKVEILNTSNMVVAETPFFNTATQANYIDTIMVIGSDTIFYNLSSETQNPLNNRPHMRLRIKNDKAYLKVVLKLTATDGTVHAWNVVELTNDVGNWGQAFSKINTTYTGGDRNYGISEPACTKSTIAVAAYSTGADIAAFSSLGPTLDERVKPDIAAPGVNIASSLSSYTDASPSVLTNVDFLGRLYPFGRLSGTSMAGPMVTGIVALLLEANPYLSAYQIKEIIQQTARQDSYTGTIPSEGSLTWGAGKINAYQAIKLALQTIGNVGLESLHTSKLKLYPNPSISELKIDFMAPLSEVQLVSINGNITKKQVNQNTINIASLDVGVYLLRFEHNQKIYQQKFIKQ